jgi:hypothetical protein
VQRTSLWYKNILLRKMNHRSIDAVLTYLYLLLVVRHSTPPHLNTSTPPHLHTSTCSTCPSSVEHSEARMCAACTDSSHRAPGADLNRAIARGGKNLKDHGTSVRVIRTFCRHTCRSTSHRIAGINRLYCAEPSIDISYFSKPITYIVTNSPYYPLIPLRDYNL